MNSDRAQFSLSFSQTENFAGWLRPRHLFLDDRADVDSGVLMVPHAPCDLVQDITTDCSVVAGLSAAIGLFTKTHSVRESCSDTKRS